MVRFALTIYPYLLCRICFQSSLHCPFDGSVHKVTAREHPFFLVVSFATPLEYGKFPSIHLSCVCEPAYGFNLTVVRPVEIEIFAFVASQIVAVSSTKVFTVESLLHRQESRLVSSYLQSLISFLTA